MNEQKEYSAGKQLAGARTGTGAGAESCTPMNYRCSPRPSPSTASSGCSNGEGDKAMKPATLISQTNSATRLCHGISTSTKTSSTTGSWTASFSSQSPLDSSSSSTPQKPASLRNPLLTWTTEELELVSQMRQGMKNMNRRKRAKKPKDAPKRQLRWAYGMIVDRNLSLSPSLSRLQCSQL